MDYNYLTKEEHFLMCDEDVEYDRRTVYKFAESTENDYFEGTLFAPLTADESMDWNFKQFKKIGDMFVLLSRKHMLSDTPEWFQSIAKPFDNDRRLQKITLIG